jgi:hypothetical protein
MQDFLHQGFQVFSFAWEVEKKKIDVREGVEFLSSVTAHGQERDSLSGFFLPRRPEGSFPEASEYIIHQRRAALAYLCSGGTFLVPLLQPFLAAAEKPLDIFEAIFGRFGRHLAVTNQSIIVWTLKTKPFVLSLSKHERLSDAPFDKLRMNGDSLREKDRD